MKPNGWPGGGLARLCRIGAFAYAVLAGALALHAEAYTPQGQAPAADGDISWDIYFLDTPAETDGAYLFFERRDNETYRALKLTGGAVFLLKREDGVESFLGTGVSFDPFPGERHVVTIRRRASTLSVIVDGERLLDATDAGGPQAGSFGYQIEAVGDPPWISPSAAQWVKAPEIRFGRRFALEDSLPGGWEAVRGAWRLKSAPGQTQDGRPIDRYWGCDGLALTGETAWDSYAARVAVRLSAPATGKDASPVNAGLVFYALSPENYYLLRLVAAPSRAVGLELVKVEEGEETVLKARPLTLAPEQWCELKVAVADDAIKAYVDGQYAFMAYDEGLVGGRVGLCAQGPDASRFDNLVVRSLRVSRASFLEDRDGRDVHLPAARADDKDAEGMAPRVSGERSDWRRQDLPEGVLFENASDYYGNVALQWESRRPMVVGSSATMTICAEEGEASSGYALVLLQGSNGGASLHFVRAGRDLRTTHWEPSKAQAGSALPSAPVPSKVEGPANAPCRVELAKSGSLITASINGDPVLEFSDPEPLDGARVRFQTDLPLADAPSGLRIENDNARTEVFAEAPINWTAGAGNWQVYSPAGGISSVPWIGNAAPMPGAPRPAWGPTILWNKGAYGGDMTLEYDVAAYGTAPTSPVPTWDQGNHSRPTGFETNSIEGSWQPASWNGASPFPPSLNAVFCADGRDLASGYCLMFSPTSYRGQPGWPIRLIRQGKVVAESRRMLYEDVSPSGEEHDPLTPQGGCWRLRIQKREGLLRFFVNDGLALEYHEKRPLNGTRLGLWTLGTPMAVSRCRIAWSESVQPASVFADDGAARETLEQGSRGAGEQGRNRAVSPLPLRSSAPSDAALVALCGAANAPENAGVIASICPVEGAVKVTNARCGGAFRFPLITAPIKAGPLVFDFKSAPDTAVNLYLKANGKSFVIPITGHEEHSSDVTGLPRPRLAGKPNAWRTVNVDLAAVLTRALPGVKEAVVDDLWLGNASADWRLAAGLSGNRIGSAYGVRNLRVNGD